MPGCFDDGAAHVQAILFKTMSGEKLILRVDGRTVPADVLERASRASEMIFVQRNVSPSDAHEAQCLLEALDDEGALTEGVSDAEIARRGLNDEHLAAWHEAEDAAAKILREAGHGGTIALLLQ